MRRAQPFRRALSGKTGRSSRLFQLSIGEANLTPAMDTGGARIVPATSPADLAAVRELLVEYAATLAFDLAFQDFARELAELPGSYAPPRGRLLLARIGDASAGCVALQPIDDEVGEMKRLFVRPEWRRERIGRLLAAAIIDAARQAGYARMRLDTVPAMREAAALYASLGFRDIAPYRFNPVPGTRFMELNLAERAPTA